MITTIKEHTHWYSGDRKGITTALNSASNAAIAWLGSNVTQLKFLKGVHPLHAAGLGLLAKGISVFAVYRFSKYEMRPERCSLAADLLGCVVAIGVSYAAYGLGIVAIPITITTALVLVVSTVVLSLLFPPNQNYADVNIYQGSNWSWYRGSLINNKKEGVGCYHINSSLAVSVSFEGIFKNDEPIDGVVEIDRKEVCKGPFSTGQVFEFERELIRSTHHHYKITIKNPQLDFDMTCQEIDKASGSSTLILNGSFVRGVLHGDCFRNFKKFVYLASASGEIDTYEGRYHLGQMDGFGKLTFENEDSYEGNFKSDQFEGEGIYTWKNGSSLRGKWSQGNVTDDHFVDSDGNGYSKELIKVERDPAKQKLRVDWLGGPGIIKLKDGTVFEGIWEWVPPRLNPGHWAFSGKEITQDPYGCTIEKDLINMPSQFPPLGVFIASSST